MVHFRKNALSWRMKPHQLSRVVSRAKPKRHPLQQRLIAFAVLVCRTTAPMAKDYASAHVVHQLVRSCTSVPANYAEARSSVSRQDFIHRMTVCLKELRETDVWLQILEGLKDGDDRCAKLVCECDELTAIFVSSVQTAKGKRNARTFE